VAAGSTVDLGDVRLAQMGSLTIDLEDPSSLAARLSYRITQQLRTVRGQSPVWVLPFEVAHPDLPRPLLVAPGSYAVVTLGTGIKSERQTVEVVSGQETRVRVTAKTGEGQ